MSAILPGLQAFSSAFNRIAMKKLLYILAGLGLAACTSDIEELPEVGPQPGREVALTGISGTASRTQFVPGDGTEIQFQWSTGDRIWAGGVQSAEAGTDGNVADFGFTNLPGAAPYRIYYNMTGTDAEAVVPTEQRQAEPGKLQLGPNGDFGYATTDSEGRFTLSHATAYVWFNPWSQDVKEKLVSVTLAATDASTVLTGTRTFDGTGFSDATDANNAVTLSFGKEGVELPATSSTASVFAAAVVYPADCSAEEIHVTYTFADGSVYTETKTGRNFEAGRIYRLTTEITKRDGGSLEIQGLEDSDEPVCMKYGASEAYALTAGGWIPTVEMTSAPAGWTADFDIARRSLLIAPPAEYTDGMDLENTVTIQSDDKPILSQEYYVLDFTHPEGTFVLIEGNMTSENGTIVYFDQHMRYHEKVYEEINDNEIGNVLQDMYLANGKIYFITQNGKTSSMGTTFNGDGRFVVCDAHTMKRLVARDMPFYANIDTSTGATQSSKSTLCWPQHIVVVSPEKAYIQYSTADNESHSGIRIVDLQTNIIRTSDIPGTFGVFTKTGATKARMIFSRGKVFAGRGNSVIVLDPARSLHPAGRSHLVRLLHRQLDRLAAYGQRILDAQKRQGGACLRRGGESGAGRTVGQRLAVERRRQLLVDPLDQPRRPGGLVRQGDRQTARLHPRIFGFGNGAPDLPFVAVHLQMVLLQRAFHHLGQRYEDQDRTCEALLHERHFARKSLLVPLGRPLA